MSGAVLAQKKERTSPLHGYEVNIQFEFGSIYRDQNSHLTRSHWEE